MQWTAMANVKLHYNSVY